ncbi:MAG TPA: GAF domain-containing protein [Sphingobium sp.]
MTGKDEFARRMADVGNDEALRAILREVCDLTEMGFAAVARVTETRWIAVQVLDRIEFGLNPGAELEIKTTICDEIRACGQEIVIDDVAGNQHWRTHHTPMLYGFRSYASFPLRLPDGSFFGTLCAIDPRSRPSLKGPDVVSRLEDCARRVEAILAATPVDSEEA